MRRIVAFTTALTLAPLGVAAAAEEPVPVQTPTEPAPAETPAPAPAPVETPAPAPTPAPVKALEPGMVRFHMEIDGKRRTTPALFRLVDYDREGALVCELPCGVPVSTSDEYQVRDRAEHTLIASKPFKLDPTAHEITASVRTGRRKMFSAGLSLAMIGPVLAISGSLLLGLGAAEGGPDGEPETIAGAAVLGAGVAMVIIGVPMLIAARNKVKLRRGKPR